MDNDEETSNQMMEEINANGGENRQRPVINGEQLDIEAYAALYSGRTKAARLLFIADRCDYRQMKLDALRMAFHEIKKGEDTQLFREVVQMMEETCKLSDVCQLFFVNCYRSLISHQRIRHSNQAAALIKVVKAVGAPLIAANHVLSDSETIRWLNHAMEKIWPFCLEEVISQKIFVHLIPWFLDKYNCTSLGMW